jgi:hypothetical protein
MLNWSEDRHEAVTPIYELPLITTKWVMAGGRMFSAYYSPIADDWVLMDWKTGGETRHHNWAALEEHVELIAEGGV